MNLRPLGYEPNELPDCSTPHLIQEYKLRERRAQVLPHCTKAYFLVNIAHLIILFFICGQAFNLYLGDSLSVNFENLYL